MTLIGRAVPGTVETGWVGMVKISKADKSCMCMRECPHASDGLRYPVVQGLQWAWPSSVLIEPSGQGCGYADPRGQK